MKVFKILKSKIIRIKDTSEQVDLLNEQKSLALKSVAEELAGKSAMYKKLNEDQITFTIGRIDAEIAAVRAFVEANPSLSEGMKQAIQEVIEMWEKLKEKIEEKISPFEIVATDIQNAEKIVAAFESAAQAVGGLNSKLGESLNFIAQLAKGAIQARKSFNDFQKAQEAFKKASSSAGKVEGIVGMISGGLGIVGAAVGVISTIAGIFKAAKEKRREARIEEQNFLNQVLVGEQEINALYRQRALEQIRIKQLRIEGIKKEAELLNKQAIDVEKNAQDILGQLQNLNFKGTAGDIAQYLQEAIAAGIQLSVSDLRKLQQGLFPLQVNHLSNWKPCSCRVS